MLLMIFFVVYTLFLFVVLDFYVVVFNDYFVYGSEPIADRFHSYIQSLLERRGALRALKRARTQALRDEGAAHQVEASNIEIATTSSSSSSSPSNHGFLSLSASAPLGGANISKKWPRSDRPPPTSSPVSNDNKRIQLEFDRHFFLPNPKSNSQFFGSSSAFSLAVEVFAHAYSNPCQVPLPPVSRFQTGSGSSRSRCSLNSLSSPASVATGLGLEGYTVQIPKSPPTTGKKRREWWHPKEYDRIALDDLSSVAEHDLSVLSRVHDRDGSGSLLQDHRENGFQRFVSHGDRGLPVFPAHDDVCDHLSE